MDRPLIELANINRTYYTDEMETRALRDISLQIAQGEFVCIEGPSGCGKSTLLSILGLLEPPTSGEYLLKGQRVAGLSPSEAARVRNAEIGFIFQSFNLIGDLTVYENVALPLGYRGVAPARRRPLVEEAIRRVRLDARMGHYPNQLSGGQQQRVAVARALVGHPVLLLADEPTGNLDSTNGEAVMSLLGELHRDGSTVVMVTHDPRFSRFATRTIKLFDGRVQEELYPTTVSADLVPGRSRLGIAE
jgi:putative ABC transport system ATP-binding protein